MFRGRFNVLASNCPVVPERVPSRLPACLGWVSIAKRSSEIYQITRLSQYHHSIGASEALIASVRVIAVFLAMLAPACSRPVLAPGVVLCGVGHHQTQPHFSLPQDNLRLRNLPRHDTSHPSAPRPVWLIFLHPSFNRLSLYDLYRRHTQHQTHPDLD